MNLRTEQSQKLELKQTLSPLMLQSLSLLSMNSVELSEYVRTEIEKNPALEVPDYSFENSFDSEDKSEPDISLEDTDYSEMYQESDSDRKGNFIDNIKDYPETLIDHLMSQLGTLNITENEREIGKCLISNLDSDGFTIQSINDLFKETKFTEHEIEKMITLIQSMDPVGVCTSDYTESLLIQASHLNLHPEDFFFVSQIIRNYLEEVKNSKYSQISKQLNITEEDVLSYVNIIKKLNPFPGRAFGIEKNMYIEPDIKIRYNGTEMEISANPSNLPEIKISDSFKEISEKNKDNKELQKYAKQSIDRATNLISMIDLRFKTLYKTATSLAEFQRDFFLNGPAFLKTLTLKQLTDKINVHESTLSRLTNSKYVETDWGIYPLKYFFSQGIQNTSRNALKELISTIIKENPSLSDQKISEILKEKGISCARRTVNKYRSEMNINSSYTRQ